MYLKQITVCGQDTMVLGKNGRHSFGRTLDRIPAPNSKRKKRERNQREKKKSIEFGNGKGAPAK